MERVKLKSLANTASGYSFRQAVRDEGKGVRVVHISDFDGLYINPRVLKRTSLPIPESHLLEPGNVILSSRGSFRAVVFNSRLSAVASFSVFVIRITTNEVLSEYLAICLNSARLQNSLRQAARGSIMSSIRLKELRELEIPVIDLNKQEAAIKLTVNLEKQGNLLKSKQHILDGIHNAAIQKQLQGVKQ